MNLAEELLAHPADRTALIGPGASHTYGELDDRVSRWRGGLAAAGIGPGDRVVLLAGNNALYVTAQLAVLGAGAAVVPLNPASPPPELGRELETVQASAAIIGPEALPIWGEVPPGTDLPPVLDADQLDRAEPAPIVDVDTDAPAALLYTSGTAGMPKPAILTHGNLDASLRSVDSQDLDLAETDHVVLAVIPLFHIFGFNTVLNLSLSIGATIVLDDFQGAGHLIDLVSEHGVTVLAGPPALWQAIADDPSAKPDQLSTVTFALSGAAKLSPRTRLAIKERFGVDIAEGYGLTETSATCASSVGTDAPVGSVGRLVPGVEARLVDGLGDDVFVGDPGELLVRGPMVARRYFVAGPAAGELEDGDLDVVDAEGWLHTGDIAVVDDEGYLAIVDRIKDIVIVSGFNVYPGEVETVLTGHADVASAGVIGEPHDTTGESLVAYVVARPGRTLDVDDLRSHCRAQLARYKVPGRFEIRDQLPTGVIGKLRRRELA